MLRSGAGRSLREEGTPVGILCVRPVPLVALEVAKREVGLVQGAVSRGLPLSGIYSTLRGVTLLGIGLQNGYVLGQPPEQCVRFL